MSHEMPDLSDSAKNLGKDLERAESGIYKDQAERIISEDLSPDEILMRKELQALALEVDRLEIQIRGLPEGDSQREVLQARVDSILKEVGDDLYSADLDDVAPAPVENESVVKKVFRKIKEVTVGSDTEVTPDQPASDDTKVINMRELLTNIAKESGEGEKNEVEKMRDRISKLAPGDGMIGVLERRIERIISETKSRIAELRKQMVGLPPEDGRVYVNNLRINKLLKELPEEEVSKMAA